MRTTLRLTILGLLLSAFGQSASAQTTAFTYQGRLDEGTSPANGTYDLRVVVFDAASGGNQRGLQTNNAVGVSNGLFTTTLDFGFGVFNGGPRWLEIGVRSNGTAAAFSTLAPRQAVLPAPYAFWSANASQAVTVTGTVPASGLDGLYSNPVNFSNLGNSFIGGFAGDGTGLNNVNAAQLGGRSAAQFWQTGGNAGTAPAANFLGTADNQPLEMRVNGQRALRLEPAGSNSVNLIGGFAGNHLSNGIVGATIAGGGAGNYLGAAFTNRVLADFGTVGGGGNNIAGAWFASVSGGRQNFAEGLLATVGGGDGNTASGFYATVAGGAYNLASGHRATVSGGIRNTGSVWWATVGGGALNTASGERATVAGGYGNTASGIGASVAGGITNTASGGSSLAAGFNNMAGGLASAALGYRARALHDGSFVWADTQNADFNSTAPNQFAVRAAGGMFLDGWLGIGLSAPVVQVDVQGPQAVGRFTTTNNPYGAVVILKSASESPTYLGAINFDGIDATPGQIGYFATNAMVFRVGEMERMTLDASGLTVNGRPALLAAASGQPLEFLVNSASAWRLVPDTESPNIIGGFAGNIVSNGVIGAFIGGGGNASLPNRVGGNYAAVLGGVNNTASGEFSTAMGIGAKASGARSTAMGWDTTASGPYSTALGSGTTASGQDSMATGYRTQARGAVSTALGSETVATNNDATAMGRLTLAGGSASTALGYRARALHHGSFVWADQQEADFDSTSANQFSLRAAGGVALNNDTSLNFGNQTRQMLNLYNADYGIGVQNDAAYFRTGNDFHWYRGGSHSDVNGNAGGGGGVPLMSLNRSGNLGLGTTTPTYPLDVQSGLAVGRFTTTNNPNGAVLALRNNTASPTYLGAINFEDSSTPGQIGYLASGQMSFRVAGGERMNLQAGGLTVNGAVVLTSDRNAKEDFATVDAQEVLKKVAALPLQSWSYTNHPGVKHVGPMAQDFRAAFGLGEDEKHIATVDADGVALAAIQGLNQKLEETRAENAELRRELSEIKQLLTKLTTKEN